MNEALNAADPVPEQLPLREGNVGEGLPVWQEMPEPGTEELKAAYEGWLERRGIDPTGVPRLEMGEREFILFINSPPYLAREVYEIPSDDQYPCLYAIVDVKSDNPDQPREPHLVSVFEADFGTALDPKRIAKDFQQPNPDSPPTPESGPAYVIVDIREALEASGINLREFATNLMKGRTEDPFSHGDGDIAVRAGGLAPGQKDAYVWTVTPIAKSVELTLNNPATYDSVCFVRGELRPPGNGKNNMAQIGNPEVALRIEGERLEELQRIYRDLYGVPDFALTDGQRLQRDEMFNRGVMRLISEAAGSNKTQQEDEDRRRRDAQRPKYRHHERP